MAEEEPKPKRRYVFSTKQKEARKAKRAIKAHEKHIAKLEKKDQSVSRRSKGVVERKQNATRASDIIFEPNKGPQFAFLASPEKEVLYGGAAGGGKSFAMLMDLLRYASNGNHRALLLRRTLAELTELIDKSKQVYPRAFPGAKFRESSKTWIFPSGATALFSYVDQDDDVYR